MNQILNFRAFFMVSAVSCVSVTSTDKWYFFYLSHIHFVPLSQYQVAFLKLAPRFYIEILWDNNIYVVRKFKISDKSSINQFIYSFWKKIIRKRPKINSGSDLGRLLSEFLENNYFERPNCELSKCYIFNDLLCLSIILSCNRSGISICKFCQCYPDSV